MINWLNDIESDSLKGAIIGGGGFLAAASVIGIAGTLFGIVGLVVSIGLVLFATMGAFIGGAW